jgi:hypothetical protein
MSTERRRNRSEEPSQATALYLAAVAARGGLEAVAVGDEEGNLVAGAGGAYDLGWLAAMGAAFAGRPEEHGDLAALGGDLHASPLKVGGKVLYLASVGAGRPCGEEAAAALGRIFA